MTEVGAGDDQIARFATEDAATVVAFYLPQYHRIPENDQWWGEGFTDWVNVRRAKSLFEGHVQPRVPTTLGYYDLLDIGVHREQAGLARRFGVGAFCYYAYWFRGRRLLEAPLDLVGAHRELDMPYAICWANETWSRRWDGSEHEILLAQAHSPDSDASFVDDFAEHLADPRYLRVDGKPLLLLYRPGLLVDPLRTTDALRERAEKLGFRGLYLAMIQSFGHWEPISHGFDAAVEFPPHHLGIDPAAATHRSWVPRGPEKVATFAYEDAIRISLSRPVPDFTWFRGVMPSWDNTARRGARASVFAGSSPTLFGSWLEAALECTYLFRPPGERLVFVNAWNEWAEGAYLEPDSEYGTARLEAVAEALARTSRLGRDTADQIRTEGAAVSLLSLARDKWRAHVRKQPS